MVSDEAILEDLPLVLCHRPRSTTATSMEEAMQKVLDEMSHMKSQLLDTMAGCCGELKHHFDAAEQKTEARLISLEMDQAEIVTWKSMVKRRVENLALELKCDNIFMERGSMQHDSFHPGLLHLSGAAAVHTSTGFHTANDLDGHRFVHNHWDCDFGHIPVQTHDPVKGTPLNHSLPCFGVPVDGGQFHEWELGREGYRSGHGNLPRVNFPQFDGDNAQLWKSSCEKYFEMYEVEPYMWIKVSMMHIMGCAACWLQSVERCLHYMSWAEFCIQIHACFGREQHESLILQLFHIRQTRIVAEYVERFSTLIDLLAA
jgi:hypothetical protein